MVSLKEIHSNCNIATGACFYRARDGRILSSAMNEMLNVFIIGFDINSAAH